MMAQEAQDSLVKILLVDDRQENLMVLETIVSDLNGTVIKARSGDEALKQLLHHEVAIIILDVNMPGLDGFETAAMIRQRKQNEDTPIIFVTAFDGDRGRDKSYALGAVDYINLPVVPEVLKTKVAVFVELHRKNEEVKRQARSLRERAALLRRLSEASLCINATQSMDRMLQVIADQAREVLGARVAQIAAALDPGRPGLARAASPAWNGAGGNGEEGSPLHHGLPAHAVRQKRPLRLSRAVTAAHPAVGLGKGAQGKGGQGNDGQRNCQDPRGWLSAPLLGRDGRDMGLLWVSDKREGDFSEEDEAILVLLAQKSSIAIENTLFRDAREANRLKDEFLATLSHELRTPLNAILGWTQILRAGRLDEGSMERGLEVIERNVRAQAQLIDDLLDISRIIAGKLRLNTKSIDLRKVIDATIDSLRPSAATKEIVLQVVLDPAAIRISADPDRLQQVVWNLVSNAIKFTPRGGRVEVRLERVDSRVRIRVSDTGIGITPQFLPMVFDRFRQADSSTTRRHGGLGIGLGIVRHLVELHGGEVRAESGGEGQGASFTVELPIEAAAPPAVLEERMEPAGVSTLKLADVHLDGLKVLLVEDDADSRVLLARVLERRGAAVESAGSAPEAMERLLACRPDVLVSDIGMPQQDGYELLRKVRSLPAEDGGLVPAVALTAFAREEDRARALAVGFQMHVSKPVEPIELVSVVANLAGRLR